MKNVLIRHGLLINIQQVDYRVHRLFFVFVFLHYSMVFTEQQSLKTQCRQHCTSPSMDMVEKHSKSNLVSSSMKDTNCILASDLNNNRKQKFRHVRLHKFRSSVIFLTSELCIFFSCTHTSSGVTFCIFHFLKRAEM